MTADDRKFSIKVVAAAVAVLLVGWAAMWIMGWDSKVPAQTALVTDYANYPDTPQAELPDGCDGAGVFGVTYSLNGGSPVGTLTALGALTAGDTVAMSWTGTTPECVGAPVVLVVKVAHDPVFDASVDQFAKVPYAEATADGGPGSLSYTLPGLVEFGFNCAYQVDAIVGLPLAVVGPNGSFYNEVLRGDGRRSTLVDAANGAYTDCSPPETTTTSTTTPTTTSTTSTTAPPVSSTVPATTVDTTPTCSPGGDADSSLSPAATACVESGNATVEDSGADATTAGVRPASPPLPNTGAGSWTLGALMIGAGCVVLGAVLIPVSCRRRIREGGRP